MQTDLIIVSEYCRKTNLDPFFLNQLEDTGLITIYIEDGERYFPTSELPDLERYIRMYYDLSINVEGIDAIRHLQHHIVELQEELNYLRSKLKLYE